MDPIIVTFEFERSTKNTHRYNETSNNGGPTTVIGALYIQKSAMPEPVQTIRVTIQG